MKDIAESKRVGKLVRSISKQCYLMRFAWSKCARVCQSRLRGGKWRSSWPAYRTCWVEIDGVIVDPTLPMHQGEYFPGLRFSGEYGLAERCSDTSPPSYHSSTISAGRR